jgi:hypothetical protein
VERERLDAMRRNPAGDWRIEDVKAVCRAFGVACVPPARGSHYDVSHPKRGDILTVPFARPIKPPSATRQAYRHNEESFKAITSRCRA